MLSRAIVTEEKKYKLVNDKLEEQKNEFLAEREISVFPIDLYFGFASEGSKTDETEKIYVGSKEKSVNSYGFSVLTIKKAVNIPFFRFNYNFLTRVDEGEDSETIFSKKNNENSISFYIKDYPKSIDGEVEINIFAKQGYFAYSGIDDEKKDIIKNKKFTTKVTRVGSNIYKHTIKLKFTDEEIDKIIKEIKKENRYLDGKTYPLYININLFNYGKEIGDKVLYLNYLQSKINFEE